MISASIVVLHPARQKQYRFLVTPKVFSKREPFFISLVMAREAFEDIHALRAAIWKALTSLDIPEGAAAWQEAPEIREDAESALRASLGAPNDAQMLPCYFKSHEHGRYKVAVVDDTVYRWMSFTEGGCCYIRYAVEP